MVADRNIISKADIHPQHAAINNFLNGGLQDLLKKEGLLYSHVSWREIVSAESYQDRIYAARQGFWNNLLHSPTLVAGIVRKLNEGAPELEIRFLDPDYQSQISRVAGDAARADDSIRVYVVPMCPVYNISDF
jgi:hypothetical protein